MIFFVYNKIVIQSNKQLNNDTNQKQTWHSNNLTFTYHRKRSYYLNEEIMISHKRISKKRFIIVITNK